MHGPVVALLVLLTTDVSLTPISQLKQQKDPLDSGPPLSLHDSSSVDIHGYSTLHPMRPHKLQHFFQTPPSIRPKLKKEGMSHLLGFLESWPWLRWTRKGSWPLICHDPSGIALLRCKCLSQDHPRPIQHNALVLIADLQDSKRKYMI